MNNRTQQPARAGNRNINRGARPVANKRRKSTIDIRKLTQAAEPQVLSAPFEPSRSFQEMPLHPRLKQSISRKGYSQPTEIQERTLEYLIQERDLLGLAQTGTGKTGAFLIPLIHRLLEKNGNFQILVMVPTRELAVQVEEEFRSLTAGLKLYSSCFIGGTNINRDLQNLRRKSHIVIGTPGRLLDLNQRGALHFSDFEVLVLDEFDRMLDMGFNRDVQRITSAMSRRKNTLLFSATLDKQQQEFIDNLLNNPVEVKVTAGDVSAKHIDQEIIKVNQGEDKFRMLLDLIAQPGFDKVLVFAETKRWVSRVNKKLVNSGVTADEIHGNKSQNYRQTALNKFKSGKVQVLVATDVAARGIDVSGVTHVVNYQLPSSMDGYIHRIGRTGRAGNSGKAYTFIDQ